MIFKKIKNIKRLLKKETFIVSSIEFHKHNKFSVGSRSYKSKFTRYVVISEGLSIFNNQISFDYLTVKYNSVNKNFFYLFGDKCPIYFINDIQTI